MAANTNSNISGTTIPAFPAGTTMTTTTTTIGSPTTQHQYNYHQQVQQLQHQVNISQEGSLVFPAIFIASALNKEGSDHLLAPKKDLVRSYSCFKASLEILIGVEMSLQLLLQQQHQQNSTVDPPQDLQQSNALNHRIGDILRTNGLPPTTTTNATTTTFNNDDGDGDKISNDGTFFIYQEPFLFTPEVPNQPDIDTMNQVKLHKARTLFNLALVVHQATGGNFSCVHKPSVHMALSLYDLCLECSMGYHGIMSFNVDCLLLSIVSLNNKAHIFHEFCESNSLRIVLDTLYLALTYLPNSVQTIKNTAIQGILFNVYLLRNLPCARAA